eukprot:3237305-Amphidinium_carterae.2
MVALPCGVEDWERSLPDSDEEFLGDGDIIKMRGSVAKWTSPDLLRQQILRRKLLEHDFGRRSTGLLEYLSSDPVRRPRPPGRLPPRQTYEPQPEEPLPWYHHPARCYYEMQMICYADYTQRSPHLRNWCYVCKKGPDTRVQIIKWAACNNVFMCREHRIFLDCIPTGNGIAICCRHTRYTPGLGSWNPVGGYPPLFEVSEVKEQERWKEETDDD